MEHRFLPEVLKSQGIISQLGLPVTLIGSDWRLGKEVGTKGWMVMMQENFPKDSERWNLLDSKTGDLVGREPADVDSSVLHPGEDACGEESPAILGEPGGLVIIPPNGQGGVKLV